jgi:CRP-like cAMP-binding protein
MSNRERRPAGPRIGGERTVHDDPFVLDMASLTDFLDDSQLAVLDELFLARHCAKGEPIFRAGDPGRSMFVIRSGRVRLFADDDHGRPVELKQLGRGGQFGMLGALDGGPQPYSAQAVEETDLLALGRDDLLVLFGRFPHVSLEMLTAAAGLSRRILDRAREESGAQLDDALKSRLSLGSYLADRLSAMAGSWKSIVGFGLFMVLWLAFSQNPPAPLKPFDQGNYSRLNLLLTTLAAFTAPLVLMVVNRLVEKNRIKAELDFDADARVEKQLARLRSTMESNQRVLEQRLALLESRRNAPEKVGQAVG